MNTLDIILLVITALFVGIGFWRGFLYSIVSFIGMILGIFLASRYYSPVSDWLVEHFEWAENLSRVVVFIVAFLLINQVVAVLFWVLKKLSRWFNRIPFLGFVNRIFGGVFGFLQAVLVIGFSLYFIERFPLGENFMQMLASSTIAPYTTKVATYLLPLLPDAIKAVKTTVDYAQDTVIKM